MALKYAPEFQNDKDVVLAAVQQNEYAIDYALEPAKSEVERLIYNMEIVSKNNLTAIKPGNEELKEEVENRINPTNGLKI